MTYPTRPQQHRRFKTSDEAVAHANKIAGKYPSYYFSAMQDWRDRRIWRLGIMCRATDMFLGYLAIGRQESKQIKRGRGS